MIGRDYRYQFARAEAEAVQAIRSLQPTVAAVHQEMSLRYAGRGLADLMEACADRVRERR
jgi:hypothetical protein